MKYFYEKNRELLESEPNKKFEEILAMSKEEFRDWAIQLRKTIVSLWDEKGQPPRVGYDEQEIIDQFNEMTSFPVHKFLVKDELTGEEDVIRNTSVVGNAVNQWFPTMMKTRINYTADVNSGKSIYDYFAKDELLDTFITYASRHFKRDSFYHYSTPIKLNQVIAIGSLNFRATSTNEFLTWFETKARAYGTHDYWLEPNAGDKEYTGYNEDLKDQTYLRITKDELLQLHASNPGLIPANCTTNVDHKDAQLFRIRIYEKGQKLFPVGLKAFRISFCQYAVNFPPLTAKYLYERYTDHIKTQEQINLYDPSSGWGGRLLGALSVDDERNIHYIGTDPNTDHSTTPGRTKYHEFADFFNTKTYRATGLFPKTHTYEIFQHGSEEIHNDPKFQKYKGKLDMIFTSPPYFAKEAYSEDPEQSYKKFSQYDAWREGFLRKTLETCVEYLNNDRYLLWNIADAVFGGEMLPLEQDSIDILTSKGMIYKGKIKMALAQMPGGNRIDTETGLPKAKNFCKINDKMWLKYEPIFVFYKP
jgi:hypothetical protein